MNRRLMRFLNLSLFSCCACALGFCEEPIDAAVCQVKANPPAYNHKLVRLTGFVSHDFEDFTFFDPSCPESPWVWLEYGGTTGSGTVYCCPGAPDRKRRNKMVVEGISIPLIVDKQFREFDKAIQPPFRSGNHGAIIHATLVGRYFAGQQSDLWKDKRWTGFGHMGCCTLLAIQQVEQADTENRTELDYGASADQPSCGGRDLLPMEHSAMLLQWQHDAENGDREWAFDHPEKVALEALTRLAKVDFSSPVHMKLSRQAQGRRVYNARVGRDPARYVIVVSRPYWLSFYSSDPKRIAWMPIAVYQLSCGD